jgi:hypothetical protein
MPSGIERADDAGVSPNEGNRKDPLKPPHAEHELIEKEEPK